MMVSIEALVTQFNETYDVPMSRKPKLPSEAEAKLLLKLVHEEYQEVQIAMDTGSIVDIAKELGDLIYVTAQQAVKLGLPMDAILRAIQTSNLSKLGEDGLPIYREDGKVVKGPNYRKAEPEIARIISERIL